MIVIYGVVASVFFIVVVGKKKNGTIENYAFIRKHIIKFKAVLFVHNTSPEQHLP